MTSLEAGDTLSDVPPVVYVTCNKNSDAPGPDGQVPLEILIRLTLENAC